MFAIKMKEDIGRDVETPKVCKQGIVLTLEVNVGPKMNKPLVYYNPT